MQMEMEMEMETQIKKVVMRLTCEHLEDYLGGIATYASLGPSRPAKSDHRNLTQGFHGPSMGPAGARRSLRLCRRGLYIRVVVQSRCLLPLDQSPARMNVIAWWDF